MAIADELALLKSTKASIKEKLTNKENPGDILSKKVFLAVNDSTENWVEISIEEGDALHAQIIKEREAQEENASLN